MRIRPGTLLSIGAAAAALQIGIVSGFINADEYLGALAVAWIGALAVVCGRRRRPELGSNPGEVALGAALLTGACALAVAWHAGYRTADRVLPLAAGAGLAAMASGVRRLPEYRRELALLGLTLFVPLPSAIDFAPVRQTAALAGLYLKAVGVPVEVDRALLHLPAATLEVYKPCSGVTAMSQMLLLAVLLLCLFPASLPRKLLVVAVAIGVGFAVNAGRVAFMAVVAERTPDLFDYWDSYGTGALIFPVIGTAIALLLWWLILRRRPAPIPPHRRATARP